MKQKILVLLVVAALAPSSAYAYAIYSESVSSSETGALSASSGTGVSSGDSNASSEVVTIIRGGRSSSSVDIRITTESNGVRSTEVRHQDVPAGESVIINVATSSRSRGFVSTSSNQGARVSERPTIAQDGATSTVETSSKTTSEQPPRAWFNWIFSEDSTATSSPRGGFLDLPSFVKTIFAFFLGF